MTATPIRWPNFAEKFRALLSRQGVTVYRITEDTPLKNSNMTRVAAGTARATDRTLAILAQYKPLGVTFEELIKWRLLDEEPDALAYFDSPSPVHRLLTPENAHEFAKQVLETVGRERFFEFFDAMLAEAERLRKEGA